MTHPILQKDPKIRKVERLLTAAHIALGLFLSGMLMYFYFAFGH